MPSSATQLVNFLTHFCTDIGSFILYLWMLSQDFSPSNFFVFKFSSPLRLQVYIRCWEDWNWNKLYTWKVQVVDDHSTPFV